MPTPMGTLPRVTRPRARCRPRARPRDARAHPQLGRDQQLHRERRGREPVGALLREAFALPSLACTVDPRRRRVRRSPRVAHRRARGAPILLVGHHDTVFPPGHFEGWREEGGRAIGPGALDMKGGLAIIRTALAALDDVGALAQLPIIVDLASPTRRSARRSSAPHLRDARDRAPRARSCSSPAARNDMIITRRKGVGAMTVIAHGKAAHAGNNHKDGANAIWALAKFVDAAQQLTDYARGVTVNVGQFTGGTSKNTVPERAECKLDLRYETVADAEALVAALRAAADRRARSRASRIEVAGRRQSPAARAHRRIRRAARRVRRVRARAGPRRRRSAAARRRLRREHGRAARRARDRRPRPARRRLPHDDRVRRARHVRAEGRGARALPLRSVAELSE